MKKLVLFAMLLGLIGCSITPTGDKETVIINKKELYELTYEWTMYKEIAIVAYTKLHGCTKEQATEHLEAGVKEAKEKQFLSWYENRTKWEKK